MVGVSVMVEVGVNVAVLVFVMVGVAAPTLGVIVGPGVPKISTPWMMVREAIETIGKDGKLTNGTIG